MEKFSVVTRPFYREDKPTLQVFLANSKEEAIKEVLKNNDVKEVLGIFQGEIDWNEEISQLYWNEYK